LKRACIEARYRSAYQITGAQLECLGTRIKELQRLAKEICEAKIESYLSA
jgi:predicted transcriptional regulator